MRGGGSPIRRRCQRAPSVAGLGLRLRRGGLAAPLLLAFAACGGPVDPARYPAAATLSRELAIAERVAPRAGAVATRCEAVARRDGSVYLPYDGRLTFLADLPAKSALRFGGVARCGEGRGRLRVAATTDRAGTTRGEIEPGAGARAMRLPRAGGPARVELLALAPLPAEGTASDASAPPAGGLILRQPSLGTRAAPPPAVPATIAPLPARLRGRPPNVLIYLIDALRRDGLACYGGRRGVSPHLDRLAAEGTLFEDAVAQGSWTRPAVASLLTGLTPAAHGVFTIHDALADRAVTLGEHLQGAGYRTLGLVANINVGGKMGFRQGFDAMRQLLGRHDTASVLTAELERRLTAAPADGRPFFAYLHTIEPHSPYAPPEPFRSRFAADVPIELGTRRELRRLEMRQTPVTRRTVPQLRALYDAEVATGDDAFGRLRGWLESHGHWRDTVVIVLADHGEEFYEHRGWEHGMKMHEETMAIPLIVRVPGVGAGRRVGRLAQQVDILPTILELAGLPVPAGLDGTSLLPSIVGAGEAAAPAPPARAYQRFLDGVREDTVTTGGYRLMVRTEADGATAVTLYDRRRDPRERRDLAARLPITTAYLRSVLRWPVGEHGTLSRPAGAMGREVQQQLKALGYLN